ncbi:hypothetical protein ACOSP7_005910 [Xanthoceras sorbifolium]
MKLDNPTSIFSNSLMFDSSSSHATLFGCTSFETNDDQDSKDSNTVKVTVSTSLNMVIISCSSLILQGEHAFIKFLKAFLIVFFTAFLEAKNFLTSLEISVGYYFEVNWIIWPPYIN